MQYNAKLTLGGRVQHFVSSGVLLLLCHITLAGCATSGITSEQTPEKSRVPSFQLDPFFPPWITGADPTADRSPKYTIVDPKPERLVLGEPLLSDAARVELQSCRLSGQAFQDLALLLHGASEITLSESDCGTDYIQALGSIKSLKKLAFVSCTFNSGCSLEALRNLENLEELSLLFVDGEGLRSARIPPMPSLLYVNLESANIHFSLIEDMLASTHLKFIAISWRNEAVKPLLQACRQHSTAPEVFVLNP